MIWQNSFDRALCQVSVTDLTTACTVHATCFTHRVWREIIMKQEFAFFHAHQRVDHLLIITSAQSHSTQSLSFTASEKTRSVSTWQQAHFASDWTDCFHITTIDTNRFVQ